MKIAVIGSTGYLGRNLIKYLKRKDYFIKEINRRETENQQNYYEINKNYNEKLLTNINVVIFLSHDFKEKNYKALKDGIKKLMEDCKRRRIKFIFFSSIAAKKNSKTNYGKSKYLATKEVIKYKQILIIPGMVYGENINIGIQGKVNLISKFSPLIPYISGLGKIYYLTHIEDLLKSTEKILLNETSGNFICALKNEFSFSELIDKFSTRNFFIKLPIHYKVVGFFIKILSKVKMINYRYVDSFENLINTDKSFDYDINRKYLK